MTKEEWEKVKTALSKFYSVVRLKVDGYEIGVKLVRISAYKNAIAIYVNGNFKGKWLIEDCEEQRRFLPKKQHSLYSKKDKEGWKKLSKKVQKEFEEKYDRKYTVYSPYFTSFGALKKQLITNNESIELVEIT